MDWSPEIVSGLRRTLNTTPFALASVVPAMTYCPDPKNVPSWAVIPPQKMNVAKDVLACTAPGVTMMFEPTPAPGQPVALDENVAFDGN